MCRSFAAPALRTCSSCTMSSVHELKDAVKDSLDRRGLLRHLQANVRAHVYKVLLEAEDAPRPQPSDENLLINELIREYLIYNGYRDTLSVFIPETGQPQQRPFDRTFLSQQLRISETPSTQQVPLLYALAAPKGSTSRPQHHCTTASADAGLPANGKKQQQQQKEKEDNRDDKEEVEEEAEDSVRRR